MGFSFELIRTDGAARLGRIVTGHGAVDTPAFMPVATQGSVKSLAPSDLLAAGAQMPQPPSVRSFPIPMPVLPR